MTINTPEFRALPQLRILNQGSLDKLIAYVDASIDKAVKAESARCAEIMVRKLRHNEPAGSNPLQGPLQDLVCAVESVCDPADIGDALPAAQQALKDSK